MEPPQVETVYTLSGPTADVWVPLVMIGGFLALFVVGLPLIQRSIRDQVPDTSRRAMWLLTAVPGGSLLLLAIWPLKTVFLDYPAIFADYRAHRYEIVAGCLSGFRAGDGHKSEDIRVGGRTFSYNVSTIVPGFHQDAADGGPIHADTWVRLFIVGNAIVRVDAAQKACPPAPRIAGLT